MGYGQAGDPVLATQYHEFVFRVYRLQGDETIAFEGEMEGRIPQIAPTAQGEMGGEDSFAVAFFRN